MVRSSWAVWGHRPPYGPDLPVGATAPDGGIAARLANVRGGRAHLHARRRSARAVAHRSRSRRASTGRPPRSRRSCGRAENRSMTDARMASRSRSSTRSTRNASCVASSPKKPSTPSRMISEQAADAPGDDRRAAGERLDRDQAERLRPRPGHQRRVRLGDQPVAVLLVELADDTPPGRGPTRGRA